MGPKVTPPRARSSLLAPPSSVVSMGRTTSRSRSRVNRLRSRRQRVLRAEAHRQTLTVVVDGDDGLRDAPSRHADNSLSKVSLTRRSSASLAAVKVKVLEVSVGPKVTRLRERVVVAEPRPRHVVSMGTTTSRSGAASGSPSPSPSLPRRRGTWPSRSSPPRPARRRR